MNFKDIVWFFDLTEFSGADFLEGLGLVLILMVFVSFFVLMSA